MSSRPGIGELVSRLRKFGVADLSRRVVRRLYNRLDVESLGFPLFAEDIADSTRMSPWVIPTVAEGPITVGWVASAPSAGSGGHTTLFRMVAGVEERGHRCILFLYDRHTGDLARHEAVVRENWPGMKAEIRMATDGIDGADAYVASSWESAHVLASRAHGPGARHYFIQDFEPYFAPRGSLYALAEDSYRLGFGNIALGDMVANELAVRGIESTVAPFGCDTDVYSRSNDGARSGVVFYTKPAVDRRGYLLGKAALEEFHVRHPEQPIHLYGDPVEEWSIPTTRHERLSPARLNELYNGAVAGLAMSFTNISLVAEELLAAGAIPVINDSPLSRADLPNAYAEWGAPTAGGIADALCRVVEREDMLKRSQAAAESVRHGWGEAQQIVADTIVASVRP